jgi:hypothetical protein
MQAGNKSGVGNICYRTIIFSQIGGSAMEIRKIKNSLSHLSSKIASIVIKQHGAADSEAAKSPIRVFVSYAPSDKFHREQLVQMVEQGVQRPIQVWADTQIPAGSAFHKEIASALKRSDVILLLLSPAFCASRFIAESELPPALARQRRNQSVVIPILLDRCEWNSMCMRVLQIVPRDGVPVLSASDRTAAWTEVVAEIRHGIDVALSRRHAFRHKQVRRSIAVIIASALLVTGFLSVTRPAMVAKALEAQGRQELKGKFIQNVCMAVLKPLPSSDAVLPTQINALDQRLTCSGTQMPDLIKAGKPFFVLGEPDSGKQFALMAAQQHLLKHGKIGLMITVRKFLHLKASNPGFLERCIHEEVYNTMQMHYPNMPGFLRNKAVDRFLALHDYWVLIDGIDDVAEQSAISIMGELSKLVQTHGPLIGVNGKGENLALTARKVPSDMSFREVFVQFQRAYLLGLDRKESDQMVKRLVQEQEGRSLLKSRFEILTKASTCPGPVGSLAAMVLYRPGLIRRVRDLPILDRDPCNPDQREYFARQIRDMQFNSYCGNDICGNEGEKSVLRAAFDKVVRQLASERPTIVTTQDITAWINRDFPELNPKNADTVLRALLGTGFLRVGGGALFMVQLDRL